MIRKKRLSYLAIVTALSLTGAACSGGGSDDKESAKADPASETAAPEETTEVTPEAPAADAAVSDPAAATGTATPAAGATPAKPNTAKPAATSAKAPTGAGSATPASPAASGGPKPATGSAQTPGNVSPVGAPTPAPVGGKANYASDVGVTADTIRIGSINMTSAARSLGPPIAGTQENTLDAYVKYVNRTGGISGRKLELVLCDDGGDIARGRACYEKLKGQVFAFMPSISWLSDVIHDSLVKDKVPWMSWGWFKSEYEDPWMFPCHANGEREAVAMANWVGKVMVPKGVKTIGVMYLNVSEDINATKLFEQALKPHGVEVVAKIAQEWDSPDESQHVLQMRSANPDLIASFSWPAPVAKFFHDSDTQRYEPKFGYAGNHLTGDPGFGAIFGDYIKDRVYSITSWSVPAADGQDPDNADANTPEHKLHAEEMMRSQGDEFQGFKWRYYGGHHITQSAWVCGRILQKAAAELGPDLTREGFRNVLESRGWESGMGVTLYWPKGDHNALPYSFNREFMYKWVTHKDGGWDFKRILPDPVWDCKAGNIPEGARTICG